FSGGRLKVGEGLGILFERLARVGVGGGGNLVKSLHGLINGLFAVDDRLAKLGDAFAGFVSLLVTGGGAAACKQRRGEGNHDGFFGVVEVVVFHSLLSIFCWFWIFRGGNRENGEWVKEVRVSNPCERNLFQQVLIRILAAMSCDPLADWGGLRQTL